MRNEIVTLIEIQMSPLFVLHYVAKIFSDYGMVEAIRLGLGFSADRCTCQAN